MEPNELESDMSSLSPDMSESISKFLEPNLDFLFSEIPRDYIFGKSYLKSLVKSTYFSGSELVMPRIQLSSESESRFIIK